MRTPVKNHEDVPPPPHKLTFLAALISATTIVRADTAFTFPDGKGGELITPSFSAVEGNRFRVGTTDIRVTKLGYERQRVNQGPELTGIFDGATGSLLAQATITGTDPLVNGYFYKDVSTLILKANTEYYVGSLHRAGTGEEYIWNTRPAQTPLFITDLGTYFKVSTTLAGGTWAYGGGVSQYNSGEIRHYVGNFVAQTVPEPVSSSALLVGAAFYARRRRGLKES